MIQHLEKYGMTGSVVPLYEMLHLKTGVNYIENEWMLVSGEFADAEKNPQFQTFKLINVPDDEAYACNSVWINDTILVPKGYPKMLELLKQTGYKLREVDTSEYRKLDGGLSCLSLRF